MPLVVYAFHYAATHATGQTEFDVFWIGMLAFALPAGLRAADRRAAPGQRWALVALIGAWDYLPKFLRNPTGPLYSDEMAHYRQTADVASSGHLYPPNTLIPILPHFPGQQALVAALHQVTGLSIWAVAEVLLAGCHVAAVVGIMALAGRLTGSDRAAAVAALVFAVNPGFMFFDAEYSYESFALPLLIWTLVAAASAAGRGRPPAVRRAWVAVGTATGLACVVTHHLSSYILVMLLLAASVGHSFAARRWVSLGPVTGPVARRALWALTAVVGAGAALWLVPAHQVFGYYSPYVTQGFSQVLHLVGHRGGSRTLFRASPSPLYEKVSAFLAPLAVLALVAAALRRRTRYRLIRCGPAFVGLAAAGAVAYFASLPFIFTTFGNEGARRSWSFSYIGVALLAGVVMTGSGGTVAPDPWSGPRPARRRTAAVALALVVVLIGNTDASIDVEYRFPGPYVYGSDTRSLTAELVALARWFDRTVPGDPHVITDRYTGLALGGLGRAVLAQPSPGFPVWELYFDAAGPPAGLLAEVSGSGYSWLVIDSRMAKYVAAIGAYFVSSEPGYGTRTRPVPAAALERYRVQPWATAVYDSTDYTVYRLDLAALGAAARGRP